VKKNYLKKFLQSGCHHFSWLPKTIFSFL